MQVFICWSGEASHNVASALKTFLEDIIQGVKPFLSSESIQKGGRWLPEVSSQLSTCNYGILCLTKQNLNARWVLFEAGALSKNLEESRVSALLVGVEASDVESPLSQFQNTGISQPEIFKLLQSINAVVPEPSKRNDRQLNRAFDRCWPDFEKELVAAAKLEAPPPSAPTRDNDSILKEILELVRGLSREAEAAKHLGPYSSSSVPLSKTKIYDANSEIRPGQTLGDLLGAYMQDKIKPPPAVVETHQDNSTLNRQVTADRMKDK